MPKKGDLIAARSPIISVSSESPYPAELARLRQMIAANDVYGIIARYPVRHSGVLEAVAKALRFQGRVDYEKAALTCISSNENLRGGLLAKLAPLSEVLITPSSPEPAIGY